MHTRLFIILVFLLLPMLASASKHDDGRDIDGLMKSKYEVALENTRSGKYIDAFKDWTDYILWAEKNPERAGITNVQTAYIALASIHFNFQDYESALDFNQRGLKLSEKHNSPDGRIRFLNNIVGCYTELGDFAQASSCNDKMRTLAQQSKTKGYSYNYEFNSGYMAKKRQHWDEALRHYNNALKEIDRCGLDTNKRAFPYSEIYSVYDLTGRPDSALVYLLKYQQYADKPYLQKDCYKELMRTYAKLGDNQKCLSSQEAYFHLTDSVLNEREFIEIRNQYLERVKAEREGHITDLEVRLTRQGFVLMIVGFALLLIIVVALLIWRQKRRLNLAYADLYERNRELLRMHDELVQERKRVRPSPAPVKPAQKPVEAPSPSPAEEPVTPQKEKPAEPEKPAVQGDNSELLARILDVFDSTDEYLNPDFSLQSLAKTLESNTKYVSQTINDSLGMNFRSLVNEYRIKEAQRRMMDTERYGNMTIQGIAESVGYKSPTNFIASFKKATGITPSIFMKMTREKNS